MKFGLIMIMLFFVVISCEKEESTNPIVGEWILVNKSVNGSFVEMNDCLTQNNLEFSVDGKVTFNTYFMDDETGDCEFHTRIETWGYGNNGSYSVENGSLFNQNREFRIENSQLLYFLEGWEITDNLDIITADLILIYEKI